MARNTENSAIDYNAEWSYPLQWLEESYFARQIYMALCYRVNLAMEGYPSRNLYQEEITSLMKDMGEEEKKALGAYCTKLPEGKSLFLRKSVNTIASQLATGVDSYECTINDPYGLVAPETSDLLSVMCEEDYVENELELMAPLFSKDLQRYGMVGVLVKYDPKENKNIITRLRPQNIWWDTMFTVTGRPRYVGYGTMIPWSELKHMVERDGDEINTTLRVPAVSNLSSDKKQVIKATYRNKKIRTLNDLDIYVDDLNRLAASPDLQGQSYIFPDYLHDLGMCYNTGFYQSLAQDPKAKTNSGYHGQDVELTVIYDLNRKIEFKIINRRYVISMNKKAFRRKIVVPITNPITDTINQRLQDITLDCPLKVRFDEFDTMDKYPHPTSPVMKVLDHHDELCSWWAKRSHVSQILATLRVETNGADATSLKKVFNVMGVILDDIQGDIGSINFEYHYDPIDSQIAHLENTIRETLCAYTDFDALQAMGDRASSAEAGAARGAVAQGLIPHQNVVMSLYADIAKQCLMNRVVYSPSQEFPIVNQGNYSTLTAYELACASLIVVKSKMAKRLNENRVATQSLALLGQFKDTLPDTALQWLIQQSMYGTVPRQIAASFVRPNQPSAQETALAMQQAQNQAQMLQQNQAMYESNPLPYEAANTMQQFAPEEVDQIIAGLSTPDGTEVVEDTTVGSPEMLDMTQQEGAMALDLAASTPELGSQLANPNGYYG